MTILNLKKVTAMPKGRCLKIAATPEQIAMGAARLASQGDKAGAGASYCTAINMDNNCGLAWLGLAILLEKDKGATAGIEKIGLVNAKMCYERAERLMTTAEILRVDRSNERALNVLAQKLSKTDRIELTVFKSGHQTKETYTKRVCYIRLAQIQLRKLEDADLDKVDREIVSERLAKLLTDISSLSGKKETIKGLNNDQPMTKMQVLQYARLYAVEAKEKRTEAIVVYYMGLNADSLDAKKEYFYEAGKMGYPKAYLELARELSKTRQESYGDTFKAKRFLTMNSSLDDAKDILLMYMENLETVFLQLPDKDSSVDLYVKRDGRLQRVMDLMPATRQGIPLFPKPGSAIKVLG